MKNPRKWAMIVSIMAGLACIYAIRSQKSRNEDVPAVEDSHRSAGNTAGITSVPSETITQGDPLPVDQTSTLARVEPSSSSAQTSPSAVHTPVIPRPQVALLSEDEIKVALDAFSDWSAGYLAAPPEQRAAREAEGVRLATRRRVAFKQLIVKDPRRAIESAAPRVVRQDLPESVVKLLEKPLSAKGDLEVLWGKVAPGLTPPKEPLVLRSFEVADKRYAAYVYGELATVTSRQGVPLRGVAVDSELAIAENAVRQLEVGERIPAGVQVSNTCPVSNKTTTEISEGEAVTEETPTVEIADQIITLCSTFHTQFLEESFRNYIQGSGSGGGGFFIDNYPGTASKAIGNLRCLYIRVTYPDQMQQPISEELAYSDMRDNARFYLENSYGKLTQTTTVTPTLVLPRTLRWYYDYHDQNGGGNSQTAFSQIHTDSRAVAKAAGYDSANYDCILVRVNQGPLLEGISWGGGNTVWLTWNGMDVINHEVGHSLGRNHANYWTSLDGTPYGFGQNEEYGNIFDNMGNGNGFAAHYNSVSKQALGWLPSSYVHTPVINGSYRVYAYDQSRLEEGKRYALNIAKDAGRTYNLEYHPAMGNYLTDAALLIYSGSFSGTNCGYLIDTTQGTLPGKNDAGIPVGRTYSDPEADLHFTTLSKNGTVPESIDVMVNKGPFPGNVAPTASFTASATTITAGASVTFTATASDTNGDTLAYFWEFDDGETGTNTSTYTRTFATTGQYTAMLTVSDMKGGSVRRSTVINVGSHGRQTISGTVTAGGVGLQGVYISGGGKGCYTNADGTYTLSGQTGTPSLTATLAGYTFTNPLSAAAGSTTANWTATTGTLVTLTNVADTAEGGTNGTFRFTRTGSTAAALTVYVNPPGGTATLTTDYSMSPSPATSGSYRTFTIPVGATQLDVTVTPANDTTAEGPETITMCIAGSGTAGSYYATGNNSVAMTIADNDTTLPQVSVTAPDRYAMEAPSGDNGTFRFARTGATTSSLALTVAWSGTATNGSDYNTLSTTVTIPAGESFVDVSMVPINDTAIEIPETVIATISTNAAYLLNTGATSATVTMSDDDAPVVTVSALDPVATEGVADTGVFMLTRTGSTASPLTVYYGLRGVAQHGTDYAWMTGEVVIPAGAASAPVVIYAFDDDMAEPTETMILAVTTFNNSYSIGTNYEATVQIVDNADTPFIDVRAGISGSSGVSYSNQAVGTSCTEGGTNPTFIIHSVGHGSGTVAVNYTVSGTATSGSDYTALSGTVNIPIEGVNDTTITVPIINDAIAEPTETLILTLTPSPNYRFYNDGSATVSIFDNENNDRVSVSQGLATPTETGTAGKFAFRRTKTVGALTVNYTISGTATNGTDYNTLSGSVTIPDGARVAEITVTPINDTAAEGTETVTVTVASAAGYGVDVPESTTLEIVDNETPGVTVGFQSATLTTDELPGLLGQYRDLPVVLSAASANTITVNYYANGGNSLGDDVDWVFVDAANGNKIIPKGTLTFAPGVTSQNIRIKINNDGYAELNETAVIQLGGAYNAGLTATKDKQTITINDAAAQRFVRMLIPSSTRYESDGSEPMLQVILDRAAGVSPITVNYAATGTATSGSDYTLTGTSLTFNTGELIKSIPLTLLTDAVNESAETIVISLSSPSGASLTGPSAHAITVLDSSAPVVATQFVNAASSQATNTLITTATATVASGRSVSSWSILSGNTGNAFALNSTNGQITLAIPSALPNPGGVQLIVRVTDNTGATGTGAINIICNAGANPVVEARWVGEEAYLYEDWSGIKSYSGTLATLTSAQNVGNDFSRRLTAYLKPATTGNYTFYIAGDRDCRLYLSTDGYESRKVKIAEVVGATGYQAWDTYLSQKSVSIPLVAGQVYWIEAQNFDNSGNDSVSVAWEGPGITRVAIPGSVLVPTAPGVSFNEPQGNGVVNTAPTISNVTDTSTGINTSTGAIAFTVGDAETAVGSLIMSGSSSNLTLVPNSNIVFGGSGANRTVTITPASGQSGNAIITLNVTDGVATTSDTFLLAVGSSQIVAFKLASSSGAESVTPANIQIEMLPANMSGSVSVDYAVGGGGATSGSDYTFTNGTMVFAPGETLKTVPITVADDSLGEGDETVVLVLGNAIGAVIGTNASHTYTIVNDDTDISIAATDAAAAEAGIDTGTFTLTRSGTSTGALTVNLALSGTGTNTTDFSTLPTSVAFGAGETVKTLTVTPVNDLVVEGSETVTVTIAAGAGYTLGSPSAATVTIADDDVDISIAATTPNTTEGGAAGVFTVTRSGITTGTTTVNLTAGGTAVSATDYTAIAGTLVFSAGQTSRTINVSPVNDTEYEDSETVTLTVAAGTGYQPASPSAATVTIADNDKPTVSVAVNTTSLTEGDSGAVLTFSRTGITTLGPLTVYYAPTGTTTPGADYVVLSGSVVIPAGQASVTVPFDLLQDTVTEAPETAIVTVSANAAYNVAASPNNAVTMTIVDDTEAVAVNIAATDNLASEPAKGDGTGTFTITRSGSTAGAVTVNLLATGTAVADSDYTAIPSTATIAAGQTSTTVTVTALDDSTAELDETVILNLQGGTGYSVGTTSAATVNLYDDEPTQVRVEVTDSLCNEAATVGTGTFTLRRLGNRAAALTLNYTVTGTATSASDYTALTGTAALGANGTSVNVTVTPINDALVEGTETVILTLATGTGYSIDPQDTGTIDIRDDETVDVSLSIPDSTVAEQATPDPGTFRITRSATAATSLTVSYAITGTATNGTDYATLSGTATIAANATTVDVVVTPANDGVLEGPETVIMTLTGAGVNYDLGDTRSQTLTIKDDETPLVTVAATDAAAAEADGGTANTGLYTFTASFAPTSDLTINYTVGGGTNGVDYTYLPGSIVLPAGQTSVTLPLTPLDDELAEGAENIAVTLAVGVGYNVGSPAAGTVVIAASDIPLATVQALDPTASESPVTTGQFLVTLNKVVAANTNVTYTLNGTATSASDFNALTGTVTVNAGTNSVVVTVTPIDDALSEGPESVMVILTATANYTLASPSVAVVTISDNEPAPGTYAVTYHANAATSGTIPSAQTKNHDVSLTLQSNTGTLARTDYAFVGWNTQPDGLGTDYAAAGNYTANAAVILFAKWTSMFNTAPTITNIADSATNEDTATSAIAFTVGDVETAAASLTVSGASSNLTLVPNENIVFGGSGAFRTVTVTPAANQAGTSTITVTVSDGGLTATDTFVLTVNAVNDAPTITNIADTSTNEDTATSAIAFTVGDAETAAASLTVSGTSSNTTLAPNANIVFGGSGASRTVTVTPVANQTGTSTITVTVSDGVLTATDTFVFTVNEVNDAPTITNIADSSTNEDTATSAIAFTIGDVETAATALTVSGTSSNLTLVPNASIVFGGSGTSRTVTVTPAANQTGTSTITVTVNDGGLTATDTFVLTVNAVNDAPTITNISDQTTNEGVAVSNIPFTVGDVETAVGSLTVSGTSSNTTLLPNANIVFGGSGANRTVTVTPAAAQTGTATVTVTVNDGALTATDTFVLTVNSTPNTAPTITNIVDSSTNEDTATSAIAFTVGDAESAATSLTVSGTSSNQALVPNANIVFGGSGASRTVTVTPVANQTGTSTITVTVSDSALTAADTFVLTVNAVNDAPTISNIADSSTNEDTASSAIAFTVGDIETAATSLTVSGTSSNQTLVPNANIVFGGSGASRTVTVTPAANQTGTSTITVTVSDGALTATDTFVLTVNAVNDAPTITNIADGSTSENTATSAIAFTIGDLETAATSLTVSGTSSNQTLVPNANIVFGGSGTSRTVTVTPAANQFGTSTITVTVSDGALTATDTFVLTVNAVSTVTFNANGGDAPSPSTKLVTYGSTYGTLASVTRSGHSLNGWFTAASGGTQVTSATLVTITDDHTLYAQWTQNFPEMDVTRGGTPVSSGSYDAISGTSAGTGVPLTYLITNSGNGNLTLGSPVVSSQSNCSVVINTAPSTTVAASGNTNLALTVTPAAAGAWSFNLSIASDDSNENPYQWMVHGVAQATTTTPFTPTADTYINGASAGTNYGTAAIFSIFNRTNGSNFRYGFMKFDLSTIPAGATITSATLDFVKSNATAGSVDIYEATGAWTETGATWTNSSTLVGATTFGTAAAPATANAAVPSISLNAAGIAKVQSWVTTPSGNNGFGIKTTSGGNGGNVDLHSREATTAGYRPKLTVTYTYTPQASEMHVARAGSPVADAATDTISGSVAGSGSQLTYSIANLGNANLTLTTPVSVSGATNCAVLVNAQPASTVTPSSSTDLVITVTPAAAGVWSANLSIANNDANENPYNWTLSGNATGGSVVDHFAISPIASPQTVGSAITGITITAQDAGNATVTSFTGTVTFGGTAGITGTSANFVAGVLTGVSVTPTVVGAGLTFTVDDGASHTGSATFNVVNDTPTITNIADSSTNEDTATSAIAFTVGDAQTAAASLMVSGTSSNTSLVPNANIVFGGSGANRTVTVTPAANQIGTSTITVTVSDGELTATDTFVLTVNAVNDAPTITNIADSSTNEDTASSAIAFTIGDVETAAGSLTVSGTSSNLTLVPNANIVFGGSGTSRTVTVTPAANQTGTATITVTVNDGALTATDTFVLTVNAVNDAPTITNIADSSTNEDTASSAIAFTIGDVETAAGSLTVSGTSSNLTLVPNANIVFGGSGTSRTVTVTPAANQTGTATITVTVNDGALTATDTFVLTVNAVNDAPTITNIADSSTNEDTATSAIAFTIGDVETAAGSLTVSGTSSNLTLVPNANIVFGGSGTSRTVTVTPAADQTGTSTITVTVSDGALTATDTFVLTVNAVNDAPTVTNIADQTTTSGVAVSNIPFTVGDLETAVASLTVSGTSSNTTLLPNANIVFGGSGASRTVTLTPAAAQTGTATVTVTVSDGTLTATDTFVLTVDPAPNTFANWISGYSGLGGLTAFNDDADGDGIANGVEAFFGTAPNARNSGLSAVAFAGSALTLTHPEAASPLSNVTGSYEWSLDLTTWNASGATVNGTIVTIGNVKNTPVSGTTTVTATVTGTQPGRVFVRAVATQN